jgi:hypothetical protein
LCKALSDFAEYVEQQQNLRYPTSRTRTDVDATATEPNDQHHAELDELFDNLDLADSVPRKPLKEMLLGSDDDSFQQLTEVLTERLEENYGETVFEIGYEPNGDSMKLNMEDWNRAYERLELAAKQVRSDCDLLLTKNVGGDKEATSTTEKPSKDKSCSGKILIRQNPAKNEDVIETRIAVVGNGKDD